MRIGSNMVLSNWPYCPSFKSLVEYESEEYEKANLSEEKKLQRMMNLGTFDCFQNYEVLCGKSFS